MKKEKEILQEECNKMISVLETVYSVTFLIIFITLCVIMFTSNFKTHRSRNYISN